MKRSFISLKLVFAAAGLAATVMNSPSSDAAALNQKPSPNSTPSLKKAPLLPSVPHIRLSGEITPEKTEKLLKEFDKKIRTTGKNKYFYFFISSTGGVISSGKEIVEKLEQLRLEGYQIRIVIDKIAASMASTIAAGFKGPRFMMKDASYVFHAPYTRLRNSNKECRIWESCMNEEDKKDLQKKFDSFVTSISGRSCVLDKNLTENIITNNGTNDDTWIKAEKALSLNLVDHITEMTAGGFPKIIKSFDNAKCAINYEFAKTEWSTQEHAGKAENINNDWAFLITKDVTSEIEFTKSTPPAPARNPLINNDGWRTTVTRHSLN